MPAASWAASRAGRTSSAGWSSSPPARSSPPCAASTASATKWNCAPRAAMTPASASAPRRSPRQWWRWCWPTICCAIAPRTVEHRDMAVAQPLQARYGSLHNISMAVVAIGMVGAAILHFATNSANAPTLSLKDTRFVLFTVLAIAMGFYGWLGITRFINRQPQVVIDREGIVLGFGRNRRFAWSDVQWVRLRRLAFRPQLQVGIGPDAFAAADLRLSLWNLD